MLFRQFQSPLTNRARLFRFAISHLLNLLSGELQVILKRLFTPKTLIRGTSLHLRPIVHHPLQRNQSLMTEHAQNLYEQLIQRLLMANPKISLV